MLLDIRHYLNKTHDVSNLYCQHRLVVCQKIFLAVIVIFWPKVSPCCHELHQRFFWIKNTILQCSWYEFHYSWFQFFQCWAFIVAYSLKRFQKVFHTKYQIVVHLDFVFFWQSFQHLILKLIFQNFIQVINLTNGNFRKIVILQLSRVNLDLNLLDNLRAGLIFRIISFQAV